MARFRGIVESMKNNKHDRPETSDKAAAKAKPHLWKPGQSGNPAGAKAGSRHRATLLAESMYAGECEGLCRKASRPCFSLFPVFLLMRGNETRSPVSPAAIKYQDGGCYT